MITVQEYIETKLQRFNISIGDVELAAALVENGLGVSDAYAPGNAKKVKETFVSIIPEMLLMSEVSEGDLTIKWNIEGVKAYYAMLCKELGIDDKLNNVSTPTITNRSNLW